MGHGMGRGPAPLHQRLAQSDRVAIATLVGLEDGRVHFEQAVPVLGEVPTHFEVKHRPSAPLPLAAGDRALLLLRGARPPYLVVDAPADVHRVADEAEAARWREAVSRLAQDAGDDEAQKALYLAWLDGEAEALRAEALRALLSPVGRMRGLDPEQYRARARAALDPTLPEAARVGSVRLAVLDDAALAMLLDAIGEGGEVSPEVARAALGAASLRGHDGLGPALAAALRHEDPEIQLAALDLARSAGPLVPDGALTRLAEADDDPRVRARAAHALARRSSDAPRRAADTGP